MDKSKRQNVSRARRRAIRSRMAATGEPYIVAARRHDEARRKSMVEASTWGGRRRPAGRRWVEVAVTRSPAVRAAMEAARMARSPLLEDAMRAVQSPLRRSLNAGTRD